jgi:hypothetical protein
MLYRSSASANDQLININVISGCVYPDVGVVAILYTFADSQ